MRIAIIGSNKVDSMENHLKDAFLQIEGIEVKIFDIYDSWYFNSNSIKKYSKAFDQTIRKYNDGYDKKRFLSLEKKISEYNPDFVLAVYKDIHPELINRLKNPNRIVAHLNPDSVLSFGNQQIIASEYDVYFSKDPFIVRFLKDNLKFNAYLYNEAFNPRFNPRPNISKDLAEQEIGIDLVTYGSVYPYRAIMLRNLINEGLDIKIYGKKSNRFFIKEIEPAFTGKYIFGEEKAKILYGSKIVVNTLLYSEVESVNCRFFETNGCGAFQLTDYRPILHDLLPIDPKLVSFTSVKECIDKSKYYLNNPKERYEISNVVYQHFMNNFTYDHLVSVILNTIKSL